jgi:monoamine oxidase
MTRKEFLQNSLGLGIGLPFFSMFMSSCEDTVTITPQTFQTDFTGKVIIIGAGAAGMGAGYLLQRYGVDFQIIEASSVYGGRIKRADNFADFPIDLGGEWIHDNPSILAQLVNDPTVDTNVDLVSYNPKTFKAWDNGRLKSRNFARHFYSEYKFKSTTWYGFFEKYIVPSIADKMVFDTPITNIDYSSDKVKLTAQDGQTFEADKVIVTIPIKVLQGDLVSFSPALPNNVTTAIDSIFVGDGFKAFIEFKERFYPDILFTGRFLSEVSAGDKTFYDAAFGKDTNKNILGLFSIDDKAAAYAQLETEQAILDKILGELDEMFDGKASENYVQHIFQNWSKEPFIQGSYTTVFNNDYDETFNALAAPIDNKVFFAGEVLGYDNQATVHGACLSGYTQVEKVLNS